MASKTYKTTSIVVLAFFFIISLYYWRININDSSISLNLGLQEWNITNSLAGEKTGGNVHASDATLPPTVKTTESSTNLVSNYGDFSPVARQILQTNPRSFLLTDLVSPTACAPVNGVKFVNSNGDKTMTYRYPVEQAYFFDAPLAKCTNKTELFIAIKSSFNNAERRSRCRKTWLSDTTCGIGNSTADRLCRWAMQRMAYAFFASTPADLSPEQAHNKLEHGDVILLPFGEDSHNLTLKTTSAMYWAASRCRSAKYVLTIDDDVAINITNLWRAIAAYATKGRDHSVNNANDLMNVDDTYELLSRANRVHNYLLLSGNVQSGSWVHRVGHYRAPQEVYAPARYPAYIPGWFTLMSAEVSEIIVRVALCTEQFWIDDVYLTGMIPDHLGFRRSVMRNYAASNDYNQDLGSKNVLLLLGNNFRK